MSKGKKKTQNEFEKEVYELVGDEYTVLSEYVNAKTHIQIKHTNGICNHEYPVSPSDFLQGCRCPICSKIKSAENRTKNHEQFCKEVYDLVGEEYIVASNYKGCHEYIIMRHNICGHEYPVVPSAFLNGKRCPICSIIIRSKKQRKAHEKFIQEIYNLVGNEYTVDDLYINAKTPIMIKHNKCNQTYPITPNRFLSGRRCPFCSGKMKKNTDIFKREVYNLEGNEYSVESDYVDAKTHVLMRHNKCGYLYPVSPTHFLNDRRCPQCSDSKGNKKVKHILNNFNIPNDSEYTFPDLLGTGGGLLRYDASAFHDKNKTKLWFLTEYDGIFHYEKQYTDDGFETLKIHDKLKDEYCLTHNIPLLRIPYWEFDNIEKIITNFIQELSSQQDSSFLIAK